MQCERGGVSVVPRVSIWHGPVHGAMVLRMENCRLLPERSMHIECDDAALPVGKRIGKDVRNPRSDRMSFRGPLLTERAELELHRACQVLEPRGLRRWVSKENDWRLGSRIDGELQPRLLSRSMQITDGSL